MSTWDDVGGNPCPGSIGALRGQVSLLRSVSSHGRDLENRLRDLHTGMGSLRWTGAGSQNISATVATNLPDLCDFWTAHQDAAAALSTYTDHLEDLQRQASGALGAYSGAVADLAAASSAAADAGRRSSAANVQIGILNKQIHELGAKRLLAAASHQPTVSIDHQLATLNSQLQHQKGLLRQADSDRAGANARVADAASRKGTARKQIDSLRDELAGYGNTAAAQILSAAGIVQSRNLLIQIRDQLVSEARTGAKDVRAVANDVDKVARATANYVDEHATELLKAWDDASSVLSVLALIGAPIPGLDLVLIGLAAVSLLGHVYLAESGKEPWNKGAILSDALGLVPAGRILGKLAKVKPGEFDNVPGTVKRLAYFDDTRTAPGGLSPSGFRLGGTVLFRIHAVPKLASGSEGVFRTLLVVNGLQRSVGIARSPSDVRDSLHVYQDIRALTDQTTGPPVQHPVSVTTFQLPVTAPIQLQGSAVTIQGGNP